MEGVEGIVLWGLGVGGRCDGLGGVYVGVVFFGLGFVVLGFFCGCGD